MNQKEIEEIREFVFWNILFLLFISPINTLNQIWEEVKDRWNV